MVCPQAFFWGKARPRDALPKQHRRALWEKAAGGKPINMRTTEQIIKMIGDVVDGSAAKQTFHKFDEDHSGRISTQEFTQMMKFWGLDVTENQANDVITAINKKAGYAMKDHLIYDAFSRAFTTFLDLENVSGGQVGAGRADRLADRQADEAAAAEEENLSGHPLEKTPLRKGPTSR